MATRLQEANAHIERLMRRIALRDDKIAHLRASVAAYDADNVRLLNRVKLLEDDAEIKIVEPVFNPHLMENRELLQPREYATKTAAQHLADFEDAGKLKKGPAVLTDEQRAEYEGPDAKHPT